jgi:hypothetical protein
MLTTQFLLGLKPELRSPVEMQLSDFIAKATTLTAVQEQLLERMKKGPYKCCSMKHDTTTDKPDNKATFSSAEMWKAW